MTTVFSIVYFVSNVVVALFVGVSLILLGAGILRRVRFKDVHLSWNTGRLFGLPLAPTLFLAGILALIGYSLGTGKGIFSANWISAIAYVCGGLFWYLGAMFSGATMITDWGISLRSGGHNLVAAWREITDYAVTEHGRYVKYVFFKVDRRGQKRRMELAVPMGLRERFEAIVAMKLDNRFDRSIQRPMSQRALEQ